MREEVVVAGLRSQLPLVAQAEFDAILADAQARGVRVNPMPIVEELYRAHIAKDEPLPDHLQAIAEASGCRRYELTLQLHPNYCDPKQMRAFNERFRLECEQVYALTLAGNSAAEAWQIVIRDAELADLRAYDSSLRKRRRANHIQRILKDTESE